MLFIKRALIGLALAAGPLSFGALGQDYIDVEAERSRARLQGAQGPAGAAGGASYDFRDSAPAAGTAARPSPAPSVVAEDANLGRLFNQVQQLQQEVMRLNGVVEEQAFELRRLKEQSLERYLDLDRRLGGDASGVGQAATGGSGDTAARGDGSAGRSFSTSEIPERPPAATMQVQPGEEVAYQAAYALVRGQEYGAAVDAFVGFLDQYPAGRYAPNAHYWLGELYLVLDQADPEAARQSFMLLLNQYPDNPKVPDALYKLGRVHFMKGSRDRSREFMERVLREYPGSSAARLAQDFLDQNL